MRLGMYYMKKNHNKKAKRYFKQYLKLASKDAKDRGYVEQYLKSL